jgi:hypothetical protein
MSAPQYVPPIFCRIFRSIGLVVALSTVILIVGIFCNAQKIDPSGQSPFTVLVLCGVTLIVGWLISIIYFGIAEMINCVGRTAFASERTAEHSAKSASLLATMLQAQRAPRATVHQP